MPVVSGMRDLDRSDPNLRPQIYPTVMLPERLVNRDSKLNLRGDMHSITKKKMVPFWVPNDKF